MATPPFGRPISAHPVPSARCVAPDCAEAALSRPGRLASRRGFILNVAPGSYNVVVIRVGIRELKNGLSAALRKVEDGETIEVTDHGRPIARIVSVRPSPAAQLIAEGRMTPPADGRDVLTLGPPEPLAPGERTGSEILAELRSHER